MDVTVEFKPFYEPGACMFTRCSLCGALVIEADQELHRRYHNPVLTARAVEPRRTTMQDLMCDDPDCPQSGEPHRKHRPRGSKA